MGHPGCLGELAGCVGLHAGVGEAVGDGDEFEVDLAGEIGLPVAGEVAGEGEAEEDGEDEGGDCTGGQCAVAPASGRGGLLEG